MIVEISKLRYSASDSLFVNVTDTGHQRAPMDMPVIFQRISNRPHKCPHALCGGEVEPNALGLWSGQMWWAVQDLSL